MRDKPAHIISVSRVITVGTLVVNVPVWILLAGPAIVGVIWFKNSIWVLAFFPSGFILAWLWWSIAVPKWRLWAYQRVSNILDLKRAAVDAQLTWPDESFFARTEIKSKEHIAKEMKLERMGNKEPE